MYKTQSVRVTFELYNESGHSMLMCRHKWCIVYQVVGVLTRERLFCHLGGQVVKILTGEVCVLFVNSLISPSGLLSSVLAAKKQANVADILFGVHALAVSVRCPMWY